MISTWHQFESIRNSDKPLLQKLTCLDRPVLVAGCQRSGTTAITRILRSGGDFGELRFTKDDELDAALILAGALPAPESDRLVLQTTYLNNHYREYLEHDNFQLVWVLRNPDAVVNSMLYNWSRGALRRLFHACGSKQLSEQQQANYSRFGHWGFSRLEMACYSYLEKSRQALELSKDLSPEQVIFLDYDQFVAAPEVTVRSLCEFFGINYSKEIASSLVRSGKSRAAKNKLSSKQTAQISELCNDSWQMIRQLASNTECRNNNS